MNVVLTGLRLARPGFELEVDAVLHSPVTAVFGASGAGKTTLLELIAGLRRPSAGRIEVDGEVLTDVSARHFVPPESRAVGYVAQYGALFPHLTVRANLLYGHPARRPVPAGLTYAHVTAVLEIGPLADRAASALSAGETQRVALGRALLAAPRLLLLDEPLAGLDQPLRERLLPFLARVRDEFAIPQVYVTHAPDEVMALCGDVLVLEAGRLVRHDRPAEVFAPSPLPRYALRPASGARPPAAAPAGIFS
jgi:molybdate transport system ATP-binding protein